MCPSCNGLGVKHVVNKSKIIPDDSVSIKAGGITPLGEEKNNWTFKQMHSIAQRYSFDLSSPINKIPKEAIEVILYGGNERFFCCIQIVGNFQGIQHRLRWSNSLFGAPI